MSRRLFYEDDKRTSNLQVAREDKNNRYSGYFYRKRRSFVNEQGCVSARSEFTKQVTEVLLISCKTAKSATQERASPDTPKNKNTSRMGGISLLTFETIFCRP